MARKVISFRCDDDMTRELESRKLPGESIMLTAQRILREALGLGVIGEQSRRVEDVVDSAVAPLQQEIEELRAQLKNLEKQIDNLNDGFNENVPALNNDVWLMKKAIFESESPLIKLVERVENLEKAIKPKRTGK
jgi:predicted  nucleic acid-binding Zn-ribbon protein